MLQSMVEEMLLYALETSILPSKTERLLRRRLQKAGYKHRWRNCNGEDEIVHVWWEEV
jgi:uncharacterized protein YcaQ